MMSMFGQGASTFSMALMDIVKERTDVRVLSADMSTPAGLDKFKTTHPEMFLNMGIAEQNMIGTAAGLADEGFRPICVAQACFLSMRCFEQIRQYAGLMKLPVILVGIGSGFSLSLMGNTHYALEDIAIMRTIPGMQIVAPADGFEAVKAMQAALESKQPTYIRLFGGTGIPTVYSEEPSYEIGKAITLKEGNDIQLIATGSMVHVATKVADTLSADGINAEVIDMHTIKPLDHDAIAQDAKLIVTIEEHNTIGGLGGAVSEVLATKNNHPTLLKIGVNDTFSRVGDYQWLLDENGLSTDKIIEKIKSYI